MGFVKLHKISSVERAIKYVLKYLFKEPALYEGLRLFSYSKAALVKKNPPGTKWENIQMTWGNYKGNKFAGVCFRGMFLRSEDGRKVLLQGKCLEDLFEIEVCFDSIGESGVRWFEAGPGEKQYKRFFPGSDVCPF